MSWEPKSLDELGFVSRGRSRHRPRNSPHLYGGPHPFIQTGDVKRAALYVREHSQTYSDAGLEQSRLWPPGTLCITIAANIADTAILTYDACFPDSVIGFVPDPEQVDVRFVKYYFDAYLKGRYRQFSQGAAQDNLSQEKLLSLRLVVPGVAEQRRIADRLACYDDLIDNNRRRIALLEQSARLLYREWFVHLRFPGHEHVKVVDGVPEGWGRQLVSEIADINARSLQRGFHGEIEYIDIASVTTGSINETTSYLFSEAPGRARRIVRHGDLIWSCVRPNRASYAMIWNPAENLVASTGFCVLSPSAVPPAFLYFGLSTQDFIGYLTNNARGAAYPAVVAKDFETYQLLVPSAALLNEFQAYAEPIFEQMGVLKEQNSKLRQARDLLLPRLMRGDVTLMECLEET